MYVGGAPVGATEHSETVKWRPLVASVFKRELVLAVKPRVMLASFAVAPVEFRSISRVIVSPGTMAVAPVPAVLVGAGSDDYLARADRLRARAHGVGKRCERPAESK